jgi:endonuclease/exonuclease/phosphatase family metal-dependent hydrolase
MTVTAVTYNVRHAVLDEGRDAWDRRRDGVVDRLRAAEPDLIALQECAGEQQAAVATALSDYDWVGVADEPGSGEHNPIGVGPRLSLVDWRTEWLSESGRPGTTGWDAAYPRVLTTATLRDPAGRRLTAYSTHFDHEGPRARVESARRLRERIDDLPDDRPAVAAGDFNAEPGSGAYERLLDGGFRRRLVDARDVARSVAGPTTTLTDFAALRPGRRVDHVFLTAACDVHRYVVDATTVDGRYPSDHLPVVVEFSTPEVAAGADCGRSW